MKSQTANAKLKYEMIRSFKNYRLTLMECRLITGKTHQIRVQAAHRGHPIVGDEIYGNFSFNRKLRKEIGLRRLFLHANSIRLKHPETNKDLSIEDPLPDELEKVLQKITA